METQAEAEAERDWANLVVVASVVKKQVVAGRVWLETASAQVAAAAIVCKWLAL